MIKLKRKKKEKREAGRTRPDTWLPKSRKGGGTIIEVTRPFGQEQ